MMGRLMLLRKKGLKNACSLLAHCGSFVAAQRARIGIFDKSEQELEAVQEERC